MPDGFAWKNGAKAAISLTFDDARVSQIDYGLPIFASYDAKVTYYVSPGALSKRPEGWEIAMDRGHEIGNHTYNHPCSANFSFSEEYSLEDYTLERMAKELSAADEAIQQAIGIKPQTFAYPCGQTFVGRGESTRSYVPLIANEFLAGRGYMGQCANDPLVCDLAHLNATGSDNLTAQPLIKTIQDAVESGGWLIFCGHDIENPKSSLNTKAGALRAVLAYIRQNSEDIWLDTVAEVATYIAEARGEGIDKGPEE